MKFKQIVVGVVLAFVTCVGAARAQSVDEIVLPAGMFAKDLSGYVIESGGYAGMYVQHGTFKFPYDHGQVLVGITTLLPESWVGKDIDIVFGGQSGASFTQQYRIVGQVESTNLGQTATLAYEDSGTSTEVVLSNAYTVPGRRFMIAIGRDPDHAADTTSTFMNFEYLALRRH